MNHDNSAFVQFFALILLAFGSALIARRIKAPYALALLITGLVIGPLRLLPNAHLDPSTLLTVFLPPLLFESALHLRLDMLRKDWLPITVYALVGTLVSAAIIGGLAHWALGVPLPAAMAFGALISATDPISVIAIFKRLGAGRRLTQIVEAESLFNDNTAIVLFAVTMTVASGGKFAPAGAILQFLQLCLGGALLGTVLGGIASRIHYELDDHLIEITLTSVVAFGSYLLAERLHVSGVMAVICAGIVVGSYGLPRTMSPRSQLAVLAFWEYAVFVVNSLVFLLIGIEVGHVWWQDKLLATVGAIAIVLVGRSAIYPLSLIVNRLRGDIPWAWQHVLFWGSLRGALSMALVIGLPPSFPARSLLVAATFGVVVFSLLVQGLTVGPLIRKLGLAAKGAGQSDVRRSIAARIMVCEAALSEVERVRQTEMYPSWAVEQVAHRYQERRQALEIELGEGAVEYIQQEERLAASARDSALNAELSALHEAEKRGWLAEEDWKRMRAEIDAELLELARQKAEN